MTHVVVIKLNVLKNMKCTKEDTEKKLKSILQGEFLVSCFNACTFGNNKTQLYYDDEYDDDDGERLTIE
jgi:hypothetical protein